MPIASCLLHATPLVVRTRVLAPERTLVIGRTKVCVRVRLLVCVCMQARACMKLFTGLHGILYEAHRAADFTVLHLVHVIVKSGHVALLRSSLDIFHG